LLLLSGIFLALAGWTRPDGLVMSVLVLALAGLYLFLAPASQPVAIHNHGTELSGEKAWRLPALLRLGAPLVLISGFWLGVSKLVYRQPGWSGTIFRAGLEQLRAGHLNLESSLFVLRSFLTDLIAADIWGILGFSLLVLILLIPIFARHRNPTSLLVWAGLLCLLATLGLYLLIANDPGSNISWWVDTGLSRMLLPGMTLLWLGLVAWASGAMALGQDAAPEGSLIHQ
jgi:hypothetical protein